METMNNFSESFSDFLENSLNHLANSNVKEAMNYALMGGGKRFRPQLVYASTQNEDFDHNTLSLACALEMVHTYSLIHDDMPCMDDDDYRRGRLTVHKQYNEAIALLAGDGLLTESFSVIAKSHLDDHQKSLAMAWLSKAAGANGMVLGQDLDLINEEKNHLSDEQLDQLYRLKTGALFGCALVFGRILNKDTDHLESYYQCGLDLGVLFQIQDDYLEAISDFETLGKSVHSDASHHKLTWITRYSLSQTEATLEEGFKQLKHDIINLRLNSELMLKLIDTVKTRKY